MPSGNFGTVSTQPLADPTQTERFTTWRFDGDDLTGLQATDRTATSGTIDVEPVGTPDDLSINFKPKGAGAILHNGMPVLPCVDAGVVTIDFATGITISTVYALAGRPIMLSLMGRPDASGTFYSTNIVDGVSFDIQGDAALGMVDVAWSIVAP